jgi:hypothetical protein
VLGDLCPSEFIIRLGHSGQFSLSNTLEIGYQVKCFSCDQRAVDNKAPRELGCDWAACGHETKKYLPR